MKKLKIIYCCRDCGNKITQKSALYGQGRCKPCGYINQKVNSIQPHCIDCGKNLSNYQAKRCRSCQTKFMWLNKDLISYGNRRKEKYIASFNRVYNNFIRSAKKRNHSFNLTREEVKFLFMQKCNYCGQEPSQYYSSHGKICNGIFKFNGIDRINSNIGYTKENSISCCKWCNWAKNSLSVQDFLNHITKIYNYSIIKHE